MKIARKPGATSQILQVFIQDSTSTTGGGLTGLTDASSGLVAYYHKDSDTTATAISLVTMAIGTFTSSGFKEIDSANMPGWYQFCPPNAAFSSGNSVGIHLKGATNMAPLPIEVDLAVGVGTLDTQAKTDVENAVWDAILTGASHNVATSAGRRLRTVSADTITSGTAQGGTIRSITLANAESSVDGLYDPSLVVIESGTGAGQVRLIIDYVGATRVANVDREWRVAPDATSQYSIWASTNLMSTHEGVCGGAGASTFVLGSEGSAIDNVYYGQTIVIRTGTGQDQSRIVTSYVGATKTATIAQPWAVIPDTTSGYMMMAFGKAFTVGLEPTLDLNAVIKASITTAATAATPTAAGVTANVNTNENATEAATYALVNSTLDAPISGILNTSMTEDYPPIGSSPTVAQFFYMMWSWLTEKNTAGVTITTKKVDGTTDAMTFTLNDATNPTAVTRTT